LSISLPPQSNCIIKKLFILFSFAISISFISCSDSKEPRKLPKMFYPVAVLETGKEPSYIITDDFSGDGNLDLISTNSGDDTLSYFKGKGDGTFDDQIILRTGDNPICVGGADFNGDKLPDLAVLNYGDQNIHIYLNTGGGSFKNTGKFLSPGKIPINLITADVNNDGFSDIVVTMRYHKIVLLLGLGKGHFAEPKSYPVKGQPTGLVTGDYNNDGFPDIAAALAGSGNVGVQIYWGKGNNRFEGSDIFRGGGQPLAIANIEVNSDGLMDLVTASNSTHIIAVFENQGDNTFKRLKPFASGEFPKFIFAADFSGDGFDDIVVSNSTFDTISMVLGRGDGSFTYPPIYHPVNEYPQGMAIGDFNKDGMLDLATTCRDKTLVDVMLRRNILYPSAVVKS
jgi:hypothetical protein